MPDPRLDAYYSKVLPGYEGGAVPWAKHSAFASTTDPVIAGGYGGAPSGASDLATNIMANSDAITADKGALANLINSGLVDKAIARGEDPYHFVRQYVNLPSQLWESTFYG